MMPTNVENQNLQNMLWDILKTHFLHNLPVLVKKKQCFKVALLRNYKRKDTWKAKVKNDTPQVGLWVVPDWNASFDFLDISLYYYVINIRLLEEKPKGDGK